MPLASTDSIDPWAMKPTPQVGGRFTRTNSVPVAAPKP